MEEKESLSDLLGDHTGPMNERRQKILEVNCWLHDWCEAKGVGFVEPFSGREAIQTGWAVSHR